MVTLGALEKGPRIRAGLQEQEPVKKGPQIGPNQVHLGPVYTRDTGILKPGYTRDPDIPASAGVNRMVAG